MHHETNDPCLENDSDICLCPIEGIITTISKKWTLQIIAVIGNHQRLRYTEILAKLDGLSSKSLADRLKELERERLVTRTAYAEIPPRVEYTLTQDGNELRTSIMPLMDWAFRRKHKRV
jgi:DNA-binding HxlR family transcriptional regulator